MRTQQRCAGSFYAQTSLDGPGSGSCAHAFFWPPSFRFPPGAPWPRRTRRWPLREAPAPRRPFAWRGGTARADAVAGAAVVAGPGRGAGGRGAAGQAWPPLSVVGLAVWGRPSICEGEGKATLHCRGFPYGCNASGFIGSRGKNKNTHMILFLMFWERGGNYNHNKSCSKGLVIRVNLIKM